MKKIVSACFALGLASFGCSSSQDTSRTTMPEPSPMESTQQMTREDNAASNRTGGVDTTTSPGVSDAGMYDPNASQTSMGDGGMGMGMGDGGMSPMGVGDGGMSSGASMGMGDGGMGTSMGAPMGDASARGRTR